MTATRVAIAAALAAAIASPVFVVHAQGNMEKCYGVAKAGKNDCAGGGHACAGQSTKSASPKEFVKLPKGTCERLVNGRTTPG